MIMNDPYVYANGVLKNKLGIRDYDELNRAEANIGFLKLIDIDSVEPEPQDANLLCAIHRHIFEDIFVWAGKYRSIPIFKEELVLPRYSIPYSEPRNIKRDLETCISRIKSIDWNSMDIDELSMRFAREMALLWKVHPFRDGNTRTVLSYSYIVAKKLGFPFDMESFTTELNRVRGANDRVVKYSARDKFVLACLDDKDYPEVEHLAQLFKNAILAYQPKENEQTRGFHG